MASKYLNIFIVPCLLCFFSCGQIEHDECTTSKPYRFTVPVHTYTTQSPLQIGDTVHVSFAFSSKMIDDTDGKEYDLKDYDDFITSIQLYRLEEVRNNPYFFDFSDTCCINAQTRSTYKNFVDWEKRYYGSITFDLIYDLQTDQYIGNVSFIMKVNGFYFFRVTNHDNSFVSGTFPEKCNNRSVKLFVKQQGEGNFDLLRNKLYPNVGDSGVEFVKYIFDNQEGGFAFEVK